MNGFSVDGNRFEARLKINHNNKQKELLQIINNYLKKFYKNDTFDVEKETPNILILNFRDNTYTANCVLRYLKIITLEKKDFSNITCSIHTKILNSFTIKKKYNKQKLLLSSLSILNNERYRDISKKNKDNKTSNNTKYNVIESLLFLNDSKTRINNINNNDNSNNNKIINESINNINTKDSVVEYNYFPKKTNNWLIQNKAKSLNKNIKNIQLETDINEENKILEYTNKNTYNYN